MPKQSPQFNNLWNARYKVQQNLNNPKTLDEKKDIVIHQNMFRREIHTNISQIKYLKNNEEKIKNNEISIIYLLELGKARKDIPNSSTYNINKLIEKEINKMKNSLAKKILLYCLFMVFMIG
jgi:hypothetical protein